MLHILATLLEFSAIIICIYRIYGQKIKPDIKTVGLCLLSLGVTEFVNYFEFNKMVTMCVYVFMTIYCIHKFHDTVVGALISILLMLIVISIMQFIISIPITMLCTENSQLRVLIINLLTVLAVWWILPVICIYKLQSIFSKRDTFINIVFCIILLTVFVIIVRGKVDGQIKSDTFVLAVPASIALLILLNKWNEAQEEKEHMKQELSVSKTMQKEYDELLTSVRLRQHSFKNHLAALLSIRYTSELPEEMAKEQEHYYGKIREANRYNRILFWGNHVISGYLYQKFQETENGGIVVLYDLKGHYIRSVVPDYYLIEMLGILIDNAIEAQEGSQEEKFLDFQFEERENEYCFKILNPYPYVSYSEIESWFLLNNSKKGQGRGLGLYHIKKLCSQYYVDLSCRNVECENKNRIEFNLRIKKAD